MPPTKNPDEARQNDIAQKSESMARELSQKREMRIRQDRVRHLSNDDSAPGSAAGSASGSVGRTRKGTPAADDKTVRAEEIREPKQSQRPRQAEQPPPFYPERRPSMLDEVATEIEELWRDLRSGFRRWPLADKITFLAAVTTLVGVMMPWISDKTHAFSLGITSGGSLHAGLAVAAVALLVSRGKRGGAGKGERLATARRTSLWHLLLGATSTLLCLYFLVIYGLQRSAATGLEIRFGLYVTLSAGMGLSYGGFARFWSRHHDA
ncbi:MAG TPA: hypothetical protein VGO62_12010 [Myxococcota bacterium]